MIITAEAERAYIRDIFFALGSSEQETLAVSDVLTEADLRGHGSHGLVRVSLNATLLRKGDAQPNAQPRIVRETGPTAMMDADRALGPYAAIQATHEAIARAKRGGVGAVSLSSCGHIGLAGYYTEMAAREGLVGLLFAKSETSVHPHGGLEPILGTNPVAIAIPTSRDPFLLDMSTAAIAAGKVREAARAGATLPEGSAVDSEGNPTRDPRAAITGALNAMGGPKGYGLVLAVEILGGLLAGGVAGPMKPVQGHRQLWAALVIALDPGAFGDTEAFRANVDRFIAEVKSSRKAPGSDEILIPGERSYRTRAERLASGIPIQDEVWQTVAEVAREVGVDPDRYTTTA